MKRLLLLILLLITVTSPDISAQKRKAERAYSAFTAGEYFDAIDQFKDAYSKTKKADKNTKSEMVFINVKQFLFCYSKFTQHFKGNANNHMINRKQMTSTY